MVWPFSSSETPKSNTDPLRDLDPSLKAFLQKESPLRYEAAEATPISNLTPPPPSQTPQPDQQDAAEPTAPNLTYSLYPDGRYAHLWKTYRPLREVEEIGKTDQDRLFDIIDGFKERKAQIGRAALENCAMEQIAISDCMTYGGLWRKMNFCRPENGAFNRCYVMQSRFLKALGYMAVYERPGQLDEDIQMHADMLYHRMLEQEAAAEEAKEQGLPAPVFAPLIDAKAPRGYKPPSPADYIPRSKLFRGMGPDLEEDARLKREMRVKEEQGVKLPEGEDYTPEERARLRGHLKPELLARLDEGLAKLPPGQREERAQVRHMETVLESRRQIDSMFLSWQERKKKRMEEGKATFMDKFTEFFQWS